MKPLIVLVVVFCLSWSAYRFISHNKDIRFPIRTALCAMFLFTAMGHFIFTDGMALMLPKLFPFPRLVIYGTGILEIVLGLAILYKPVRPQVGWALILLLCLFLPANIYAAYHHINMENPALPGPGLNYLWFRIPFQLLLLYLVYLSCTKRSS